MNRVIEYKMRMIENGKWILRQEHMYDSNYMDETMYGTEWAFDKLEDLQSWLQEQVKEAATRKQGEAA